MQIYTYACGICGSFDLMRAMSDRGTPAQCPQCGRQAKRKFTAPHLSRVDPALNRAVTNAGLSAEIPDVTDHVPATTVPRAQISRPGRPPLPRP